MIANLQIVNDLDKMELLEQSAEPSTPIFGEKVAHNNIYEMVFPRLMFLNLSGTLIDAHLEIFRQFSPLFLKYLETRERINPDPRDYKNYSKRRRVPIPACMNAARWRGMSINEQYEAVFGGSGDPSRQKLRDLPYFVRIVTRKRRVPPSNSDAAAGSTTITATAPIAASASSATPGGAIIACVYCGRGQCKGCPLTFDDKVTLQQVID